MKAQQTKIHVFRWRWLVWALWAVVILLYCAQYLYTLRFNYDFQYDVAVDLFGEVLPRLNMTPQGYASYFNGLSLMHFTLSVSMALLLFWKRSHDPMALLASLTLLGAQSFSGRGIYALMETQPQWIIPIAFLRALSATLVVTFLCAFPDGRFVPRWSRWLIPFLFPFNFVVHYIHFNGVEYLVLLTITLQVVIGTIFQAYRYRHISTPEQRQQTKWVLYGWAIVAIALMIFTIIDIPISPYLRENPFVRLIYRLVINLLLIYLPACAIPVSFAIAVLRYRLWDVDFVINRSLVYGALTLLLGIVMAGGFFAIRALLDLLFQTDQSQIALVAASAIVALLFEPFRVRLRRFVDKRFYGIELDYSRALKQYASRAKAIDKIAGDKTSFGPFTDLKLLGKGGMGEVYRAQDTQLNRVVAIKLLPESAVVDENVAKRFIREAQTMASLKHPNIINLYDFGEQGGVLYMVMEYINGLDLSEVLTTRGTLPLSEALIVLEDIIAAIDYVHSQGIVHRDVKPSNVMLEPITSTGSKRTHRTVLMDFGVAKSQAALSQITQDAFVGTLDYISPEQIQGAAEVDLRADIYSIGVMTYQLLTGQLPFKRSNPGATIVAHLLQPPPDPTDVIEELPYEVGDAVRKAMAKKPEDRFSTAGEFLQALSAA